MRFRFCPRCATALAPRPVDLEQKERLACPAEGCGFVLYENPVPVVAGVVENQGGVLLVRNHGWPDKMLGLVTGFLEKGEDPALAIVRELKEELGLDGRVVSLIGLYPFEPMNQLIVAYHLVAEGEPVLGAELAAFKRVAIDKIRTWDFGTGQALKDWLAARKP